MGDLKGLDHGDYQSVSQQTSPQTPPALPQGASLMCYGIQYLVSCIEDEQPVLTSTHATHSIVFLSSSSKSHPVRCPLGHTDRPWYALWQAVGSWIVGRRLRRVRNVAPRRRQHASA